MLIRIFFFDALGEDVFKSVFDVLTDHTVVVSVFLRVDVQNMFEFIFEFGGFLDDYLVKCSL